MLFFWLSSSARVSFPLLPHMALPRPPATQWGLRGDSAGGGAPVAGVRGGAVEGGRGPAAGEAGAQGPGRHMVSGFLPFGFQRRGVGRDSASPPPPLSNDRAVQRPPPWSNVTLLYVMLYGNNCAFDVARQEKMTQKWPKKVKRTMKWLKMPEKWQGKK